MLVTASKFHAGYPVRMAIRPERTALDNADGPNRLPATVTFVRDLGPHREYHLDTAIGPMIVEYAIGEGAQAFRKGDRTEVRLPPDAIHVFPHPSQMAAE